MAGCMQLVQQQGLLTCPTRGPGFVDITRDVAGWLAGIRAVDGVVTLFIRHTSASLVIQENADPDVLADLGSALDRLAPRSMPWRHSAEGPDDMPAHVRSMLTGVSHSIPVASGRLRLGTWQALYVAEHRDSPHERQVALVFVGTVAASA